jgi:hypothetical protein
MSRAFDAVKAFRFSYFAFISALVYTAANVSAQDTTTVSLPDSLVAQGTKVVWVKKVPFYCEGPAFSMVDSAVYFTEQHGNDTLNWPIWKINPANPSDSGSRWIVQSN